MGYKAENQKIISETDGLELDMLTLIPDGKIRAIIQIHHGMCEHKERYLPFMEYMADAGFVVAIHDCRGHGKSIRSMDDFGYMYGGGAVALVEDTHQITTILKDKWKDVPFILLGHSMGSLVVRMYAKTYNNDLDMLIVCGSPSKNPMAKMGMHIANAEKKILGEHYVSKLLYAASIGAYAKKFPDEKSEFSWCCSDQAIIDAYEQSPLCGFPFTVDGYCALFELMEETYSKDGWNVNHSELPVLFIGGGQDPCIGGARKYAQAVQFMRKVGFKKTRGRLYPNMRHEILNEIGKQQVYQEVLKYIEKIL